MRKYKNVKRKEIVFELEEWALIEAWAAKFKITTTEYIKQATLTDKITISKSGENNAVLLNALKKIGTNINQLSKKANEINSIYAGDYEKMREEYQTLCRTLSKTHFSTNRITKPNPPANKQKPLAFIRRAAFVLLIYNGNRPAPRKAVRSVSCPILCFIAHLPIKIHHLFLYSELGTAPNPLCLKNLSTEPTYSSKFSHLAIIVFAPLGS